MSRLTTANLVDVHRYLNSIDYYWFKIGLQLRVNREHLKYMDTNYHNRSSQNLLDVLELWLENADNPTWEDIVKILREDMINNPEIADKICQEQGKYHRERFNSTSCKPEPNTLFPGIPLPFLPFTLLSWWSEWSHTDRWCGCMELEMYVCMYVCMCMCGAWWWSGLGLWLMIYGS